MPDCNQECSSRFYPEKKHLYPATSVHRMRDRVLRSLVRQVMRPGAPQVPFG